MVHANERLGGRSLLLVRHPIAASLTQRLSPHLEMLLQRQHRYLSEAQRREGARIVACGSDLERGVLAWCLYNLRALGSRSPHWNVLSYEQLLLEPERSALYLADCLALPDTARLLKQLGRSRKRPGSGLERQIDGWRERVPATQERQLMGLLELFALGAYRTGDPLPAPDLWLSAPHAAQPLPRHRPGGLSTWTLSVYG